MRDIEKYKQILDLLCEGDRPKEIGEKMELSNRTIETYIGNMLLMHNCKNVYHLVAKYCKKKLKLYL